MSMYSSMWVLVPWYSESTSVNAGMLGSCSNYWLCAQISAFCRCKACKTSSCCLRKASMSLALNYFQLFPYFFYNQVLLHPELCSCTTIFVVLVPWKLGGQRKYCFRRSGHQMFSYRLLKSSWCDLQLCRLIWSRTGSFIFSELLVGLSSSFVHLWVLATMLKLDGMRKF